MKTNKKMIETVIFYLAIILVFVGGFGFLRGFVTSIGTVKSEKTFERLPLGDLRGIAVDNNGRVYCGLQFYGRVQVYNNQGKFIYALKIKSFGGAFQLDLDNEDNLLVKNVRDQIYVFNEQGKLINEYSSSDRDFGNRDSYRDIRGVEYKLIDSFLNPHIIKIEDHQQKIIIWQSFFNWVLMGPWPSWLFFAIGLLIMFHFLGFFEMLISKYR